MSTETSVWVRMIEGTWCWVPVPAVRVQDEQHLLLPTDLFDPDDSSTLLEYLPGDLVRLSTERLATSGVMPNTPERAYWAVLFDVVGEQPLRIAEEQVRVVRARLASEVERNSIWHYPAVRDWLRATEPHNKSLERGRDG